MKSTVTSALDQIKEGKKEDIDVLKKELARKKVSMPDENEFLADDSVHELLDILIIKRESLARIETVINKIKTASNDNIINNILDDYLREIDKKVTSIDKSLNNNEDLDVDSMNEGADNNPEVDSINEGADNDPEVDSINNEEGKEGIDETSTTATAGKESNEEIDETSTTATAGKGSNEGIDETSTTTTVNGEIYEDIDLIIGEKELAQLLNKKIKTNSTPIIKEERKQLDEDKQSLEDVKNKIQDIEGIDQPQDKYNADKGNDDKPVKPPGQVEDDSIEQEPQKKIQDIEGIDQTQDKYSTDRGNDDKPVKPPRQVEGDSIEQEPQKKPEQPLNDKIANYLNTKLQGKKFLTFDEKRGLEAGRSRYNHQITNF